MSLTRELFFIEWEDSYGCSSTWQDIDPNGRPQVMTCHSVGWVIRQTKRCVVIVPHMSANTDVAEQQGCGDMTIPTACILRMVPLAVPIASSSSPARGRKRLRS